MAQIVHGGSIADGAMPADVYALIDNATITNIVAGDITDGTITSVKLAQITTAGKVSGAALTALASIPAGAGLIPSANLPNSTGAIVFVIDGGGSAISTGIKGDVEIPFACTLNQVTMLADQSGSIVVDIWKDTYANYPPTDADSITASAVPTISTATKSQDTTLTAWTTAITAGNILRFNVDSCATITRCTIVLKYTR